MDELSSRQTGFGTINYSALSWRASCPAPRNLKSQGKRVIPSMWGREPDEVRTEVPLEADLGCSALPSTREEVTHVQATQNWTLGSFSDVLLVPPHSLCSGHTMFLVVH